MTNQSKSGANQKNIYTFLDFEINPNLREINQLKTPLKMSKKSFDILVLLIEKQGSVVTKDEIINRVWPDQIVTDAALNKQITRLRSDLTVNQSTEQPIIETVRGVGIKLIPTVYRKDSKPTSNKSKKTLWATLITVLLLISTMSYFSQNKGQYQEPLTTIKISKTKSLNIALVPSQNNNDWLNVGGLNYLAEQLQKNPEIQTLNPLTQWFDRGNTHELAIEVSLQEGIDYVLAVYTVEDNENYISQLELRNPDGIVAKESIQSTSISGLYDKINSWIIRQMKISSKLESDNIYNYKTTNFVLESYLRGREVAIHKSYEKALQLFETATVQDVNFLPAWIALAEMEARLGNNQKALALVDIVSKRKNFNPNYTNKILVLKANFLMGLAKIDEAKVMLDEAIKLSVQKNDKSTQIDAITILIQTHMDSGKISQKTVELSLRQLALLDEYRPDPYIMALAKFNLAVSYHYLGQIDLAIRAINSSIKLYTKANNLRGIVIGNSLLARIYKDMGDTGLALLTLEKIEGLIEQIDGIDEQQIYWQYKAENQIYHGLRNEALVSIDKLKIMGLKNSNLGLKIIALSLNFELNEIHKNYDQAKINVKQMLDILESESQGYPPIYNDLILAYDMFISALADDPSKARKTVNKHLQSNPNIKSFFAKELRMIEATILTKENKVLTALQIYHNLLTDYIKDNELQDALFYAGYPILEIQWQNNMQDYVKTMNYLDEIAVFKYPIHKYKAQYLAYKKDYINAYVMMEDLKSKANQFWTTKDQILLEEYQELAKSQ